MRFALTGAVFGLLAVVLGAFGSHSLKDVLDADALAVYETAVRYQMYHALALLALGWLEASSRTPWFRWAGSLFVAGTVLFSGSLFAWTVTGTPWLGAVTPLGGLLLVLGWACLGGAIWAAKGGLGER